MDIDSILTPERTVCSVDAKSKKRAIEYAATHIVTHLPNMHLGEVYRGLLERERLGTTGLGEGVAIPHCRLKSCTTIVGGLYVFDQGVDFAALDDELVRIMFVLLVPESENSEHLSTLALLAQSLQDPNYRQALIEAPTSEALFEAAVSSKNQTNRSQNIQ